MGRPSRPLVTREGIMRAALELVDEEGANALSTTRIAARLGVKGPSLYNHISGREEIIDGIAELMVAEMELDTSIRPWTAAVASWARSYRAAFAAHPHMVPLLAGRPTQAVPALQGYAEAFAILREAGWPEGRLLTVVQAIEYFIIGSALHHDRPRPESLPSEDLRPGLAPLLNAPPNIRELAFEAGLAALIRGFEQALDGLRTEA